MHFIYPGFLWALTLIAIPIIIHFFNFHRYKTVYFSNVRFLQQIKREHKSRSNLRNLLVLLFRILTIIFLVLVFSRPYIPIQEKAVKQKAQNKVLLYIDNSFSMEAQGKYGTLIEWAKMRAHEITAAFPPSTQYLLITNEFDPTRLRWVSRDQFIEWVSQIQTTHIAQKMGDVIERQQLIASDTNFAYYSFILSDFQKSTSNLGKIKPASNMQFFLIPFQSALKQNVMVDSVWFSSPGLYPGKPEEMVIRIRNYGESPVNQSIMQFYLNDSLKSSLAFDIEPNASVDIKCNYSQGPAGLYRGRIEITDYPVVFDNQMFFSYKINPVIKVMRIGKPNNDDRFKALFYNDPSFDYQYTDPLQLRYDMLNQFQLVILDQTDQLSSGLKDALINYVRLGGHLVLIPAPDQSPFAYQQLITQTAGPSVLGWTEQNGVISDLDKEHALFKDAIARDDKDSRLPDYKGYYRMQINQRQSVKTLFKSESGDGLFFEYTSGNGKIYLSAIPCQDAWTNLLSHPLFIPLFYNMALQSTTCQQLYYILEGNIAVPVFDQSSSGTIYSLKHSVNQSQFFPLTRKINNKTLLYPSLNDLTAGHWMMLGNDQVVDNESFNFSRIESVIDCYTPDEILNNFKTHGLTNTSISNASNKLIVKDIEKQRQGTELWQLFLLLSVLMLMGEMTTIRFLH